MSDWANVFLGVIAAATLAIAVGQVGVLVVAGLLARRVQRLVSDVEREMKPLFGHLDRIGHEASRTAALTSMQVERVDSLFADLAQRAGETAAMLQKSVIRPVREGSAVVHGFKAAFEAIRRSRRSRSRQGEGEEALFI